MKTLRFILGDQLTADISSLKDADKDFVFDESEADLKTGKISVTSPIGKGLLGKEVGDVAEITVPNGTLKFDILEISRS